VLFNFHMNRLFLFFALASVAILTQKIFGADQNENEAQIRNVVQTQQQEAWNRHDAKAYSDLFTQDADLINVVGWWWKGRPQIEQKLRDAYTFVFRESTLNINEVEVKFLTPEIAVAHVRWSMGGARTPKDVPEPRQGVQTLVLQKHAGKWLIAAFQNTNAIPEMPFPKGPPTAPSAPSVTP
jgi:uncharacterized protein (TIGR02246 family)